MSNKFIELFILACISTPICAQNLEFESPDKKLKISIADAIAIGSDWGKERFSEHLTISLVDGKSPPLWSGIAYKDETGFLPELIWSRLSKTALFVYRPQRGEIVLAVFRPSAVSKYEPIFKGDQLEKLALSMNNDPRDAVKQWAENWVETIDDVYEGDVLIAATKTRKLHVQIDTRKIPLIVSILHQQDTD